MIEGGLNLEPPYIGYLNQVAALHDGNPPRNVKESLDATVEQVLTDITVAELIGMIWVAASDYPPTQPVQRELAAVLEPDDGVPGWGYKPGGISMSQDSAMFQSSVSGKPAYLVRQASTSTYTWHIEEYGFYSRTANKVVWFDDFREGILIDAKAIPQRWIAADGTFNRFAQQGPLTKFVQDAARQIQQVAGDHPIQWQLNSQAALDAWLPYLRSINRTDILDAIEFVVGSR